MTDVGTYAWRPLELGEQEKPILLQILAAINTNYLDRYLAIVKV